jgi:hypothetical protein
MMMTIIEPRPGHEVGYNRWYEEDHLYTHMQGPGVIAATRFVARATEKRLRQVDPALDPARGAFLAVYWFVGDGSVHRAWRESGALAPRPGSSYPERDYVYGFLGQLAFSSRRKGYDVPIELALDARFPHLVLSIVDLPPSCDHDRAALAYAENYRQLVAEPASPVALAVGFFGQPQPNPVDPSAPYDAAEKIVVLSFCDDDPTARWDDVAVAHREAVAAAGIGRLVWLSPFVPTVVGTDTYMDELRL